MDGLDTWALPELLFSTFSHEIVPPFVAVNSFGHFCPKADAAKPLLPDNECNEFWEEPVVGPCGPFPRRLQNQGCFWEGINPTCPSLVYSQVCHMAGIPYPWVYSQYGAAEKWHYGVPQGAAACSEPSSELGLFGEKAD